MHFPSLLEARTSPQPTARYQGAAQVDLVKLLGGEAVPVGNEEVHEAEDLCDPHLKPRCATRGRAARGQRATRGQHFLRNAFWSCLLTMRSIFARASGMSGKAVKAVKAVMGSR